RPIVASISFAGILMKLRKVFAIIVVLSCGSVCVPLMAQTTAGPEITQSEESPSSNVISSFTSDFLRDQKDIWTSPLRINRTDFEWLAPVGASAGVLFAVDHRIINSLRPDTSLRAPSNTISQFGVIVPYAAPGTMWFLGAATHNNHAREAGRLAAEAELDSEVVIQVLKFAT